MAAVVGVNCGNAAASAGNHYGVTISTKATRNMTFANGVYSATADKAVLNVNDLTTALAAGSVTVTTGFGSGGDENGDLHVDAGFTWAGNSALTLDAYHTIFVTQQVVYAGPGALTLSDNDGGPGGVLVLFTQPGSISFLGAANRLTIDGAAYKLVTSIASLAAAVRANNDRGNYALANNYDASNDGVYKAPPIPKFHGAFNGLGNKIDNFALKIDHGGFPYVALFSEGRDFQIASVNIANADVEVTPPESNSVVADVGVLSAHATNAEIFNAFVSGKITVALNGASSGTSVGGLIGTVSDTASIVDSAASVSVSVQINKTRGGVYAGGLAGSYEGAYQDNLLTGSFATGSVTVTGESAQVFAGGLVGYIDGYPQTIENCYAEGAVSVPTGGNAGGLLGFTGLTIANSYATGALSGATGVGAFVGFDKTGGSLSDNYWDTTTSGITNLSQGAGNVANDPGITGLTTTQLQSGLPAGFDPTIWAESPSINNGLPYLVANPPQ